MSTPAKVYVEGNGTALYQHWDGYPSGILYTLKGILKVFKAKRGFLMTPI